MSDFDIRARLAEIEAKRAAMDPADRAALEAAELVAQRESWVRAMAPCEHGDPDWETCPQCRKPEEPPMTQPSPTPDDVRRLFDEASDGPWFVEPQDELNAAIYPLTVKNADWALAEVYGDVVELPADANARFIAAARSGWPADRERADRAEAALRAALWTAEDAPELNPSNYDHDDVCQLNSSMIEVWKVLSTALASQP